MSVYKRMLESNNQTVEYVNAKYCAGTFDKLC